MKLKNKMFILFMIMLILFGVSFASATQNDVATDEGENGLTEVLDDEMGSFNGQNNLSSGDNSYSALNSDIFNSPEGGFELNKDYAYVDGEKDSYIKIEGDKFIGGNFTIDGNGHSISGSGKTRVFYTDAQSGITLTLKNLIIRDATSSYSGAVYVAGNVNYIIINCTFINNNAGENGGAIYFDSSGQLEIKDSTFDNNHANKFGGAIYSKGTLEVENSIFRNNRIDKKGGGAIYLSAESNGIKNSIFENNKVTDIGSGGAIYISDNNKNGIKIENSRFSNSYAFYEGGAIFSESKGTISIIKSNFTDNDAKRRWGSDFFSDMKGGAISADNDIEIEESVFINNHAQDKGGAVYTSEGIRWLGNPSIFIGNHVDNSNTISANKAGAVYASTFRNDAEGLVFINNTA